MFFTQLLFDKKLASSFGVASFFSGLGLLLCATAPGGISVITGVTYVIEGISGKNIIRDKLPENLREGYDVMGAMAPMVATAGAVVLAPHVRHVPKEARDTYRYIDDNAMPPDGYVGGRNYQNKDGQLPAKGAPYYEYDIKRYIPGVNRGAARIVEGVGRRVYYTPDHYGMFRRFFR